MDPLSIAASVAGVATFGASLASALYDIVASIRDAPREMVEIAQGMHELSVVLRELRRVIKKAHKLLREQLLKAIASATGRIRDTHDRVDRLLDAESGLSRVIWAFQRTKTTKLLATIESHKSTVQLMATTMTLALVQREKSNSTSKSGRHDGNRTLRLEAETLVRATERSLQELSPQQGQRDQGVQTDEPIQDKSFRKKSSKPDATSTPTHLCENQLQKWEDSPEDTAKWLYRLVFQTDQVAGPSLDNTTVPNLLLPVNRATKAPVVDKLLSQWTKLTIDEIRETSVATSSSSTNLQTTDLEKRVRLLEGQHFMSKSYSKDQRGASESRRFKSTSVPPPAPRAEDQGGGELKMGRLAEDHVPTSNPYPFIPTPAVPPWYFKAEPVIRNPGTGHKLRSPEIIEDKLAFAADYMDTARRKSRLGVPPSPYDQPDASRVGTSEGPSQEGFSNAKTYPEPGSNWNQYA